MKKTTSRIRGTTPEIEQAVRYLRAHFTPAEAYLWEALRNKKLQELRFRCQHPIGRFIVDFCCPARRLIIEVDGESHHYQREYDTARTEQLISYGYHVLRFSNQEVLAHRGKILEAIRKAATSIEHKSLKNWNFQDKK